MHILVCTKNEVININSRKHNTAKTHAKKHFDSSIATIRCGINPMRELKVLIIYNLVCIVHPCPIIPSITIIVLMTMCLHKSIISHGINIMQKPVIGRWNNGSVVVLPRWIVSCYLIIFFSLYYNIIYIYYIINTIYTSTTTIFLK